MLDRTWIFAFTSILRHCRHQETGLISVSMALIWVSFPCCFAFWVFLGLCPLFLPPRGDAPALPSVIENMSYVLIPTVGIQVAWDPHVSFWAEAQRKGFVLGCVGGARQSKPQLFLLS